MLPTAVFAVLALTSLRTRPLWRDEMATREFALLPWTQLWEAVQHVDLVLLPYYALMHLPVRVGDGVVAMRLPSALAAIGVVALVALTGRLLWGRIAALAGGLTLATNGVFLGATALQARPGALAQFFLMVAAVATILAVRRGVTTARMTMLVGGGVAAMLMQPFSVLLLIPFALLLIRRTPYRRALLVAAAVIAASAAAVLAATHAQASQTHWLSVQSPRRTLLGLQQWSGLHEQYLPAGILLAAVLVQVLRRRVDPRWWVWFLAVTGPPLALYLVSLVYTPLFYPRYAVLFAPALSVLLGGSVALVAGALSRKVARVGTAGAMCLMLLGSNATGLYLTYGDTAGIDDISTMGAHLSDLVAPGDTVVFLSGFSADGWTYGVAYYSGDRAMQRDIWSGLPGGTGWMRSVRRVTDVDPLRTVSTDVVQGRVWVIEFYPLIDQLTGLRAHCTRAERGIIEGTSYEQFDCREPVRVGR